jgi:hypothetical protein
MKKSIVIGFLIFLLIGGIVLIRMIVLYKTEIDTQESKVYSFSGEDTNIRISNGFICTEGINLKLKIKLIPLFIIQ